MSGGAPQGEARWRIIVPAGAKRRMPWIAAGQQSRISGVRAVRHRADAGNIDPVPKIEEVLTRGFRLPFV